MSLIPKKMSRLAKLRLAALLFMGLMVVGVGMAAGEAYAVMLAGALGVTVVLLVAEYGDAGE